MNSEYNLYYLHQSARTVAWWLNDTDSLATESFTAGLISNAIQFSVLERVQGIRCFDGRFVTVHLDWVMKSIEHFLWVYDLFAELEKRNYKHKRRRTCHDLDYADWKFHLHINDNMDWLPRRSWEDPPMTIPVEFATLRELTTIQRWRLFYSVERRGPFKKVKPPFWMR